MTAAEHSVYEKNGARFGGPGVSSLGTMRAAIAASSSASPGISTVSVSVVWANSARSVAANRADAAIGVRVALRAEAEDARADISNCRRDNERMCVEASD